MWGMSPPSASAEESDDVEAGERHRHRRGARGLGLRRAVAGSDAPSERERRLGAGARPRTQRLRTGTAAEGTGEPASDEYLRRDDIHRAGRGHVRGCAALPRPQRRALARIQRDEHDRASLRVGVLGELLGKQ